MSVVGRMQWKLFFAKTEHLAECETKDSFGFKSLKTSSSNNLLLEFEKDLFFIIDKIKYVYKHNCLQMNMKKDITNIHNSDRIIIKSYEISKSLFL